jgi:hypothetical protein
MQIKEFEMGVHVVRMWEKCHAHKTLVARPEKKRPLRKPRHKWGNNIKMYLRKLAWTGLNQLRIKSNGVHF